MTTLKTGCKAYYDTFNGLIPCVVLSVKSKWHVEFKLTANRAAYKRGEILSGNSLHVIPREAVYVRSGQCRIKLYQTEVD